MREEVELVRGPWHVTTMASGGSVRDARRLQRVHGPGRWRKRKGVAIVRLPDGSLCEAEVHWYEAHGVGRRELNLKRLLDDSP